jgi:hypothetical protein
VGYRGNQGTQQLCLPAVGSGDHSVRRQGYLLWPRAGAGRGKGTQGGLHVPEHPIDAPQGAGSWRRRQGDGAFRAPPGAGPHRVRALEVPDVVRFIVPRIGAPRSKGPPAPVAHRAGTFSLFLLPGGHPRCFTPELIPAVAEEAEGSISLGVVEEEVALEDEGEVLEVSRRQYLRGAVSVVASNFSAGTEALAQCSAAKRRAIMMVDASGTAASPAVSSHQLRSRHVSAASASSHGPLTARLTHAIGGPLALRSLRRARSQARLLGATVGVLDTGVS